MNDNPYWYRMPSGDVLASPLVLADRNYWRAMARAICDRDDLDPEDGGSGEVQRGADVREADGIEIASSVAID